MIELVNVSKSYPTRKGRLTVLDRINMTVRRGEKVGILGGNGAGKSTLVRILGGSEQPTGGTIHRHMNVSWPLAFSGGFQGSLTGLDNLRFICRIYGVDWRPLKPFIEDFSELGTWFREPVKTYSSGMRARLAFALSMAIEFDCYLIDEVMAVGDARFQEKCKHEMMEKRRDRGIILVSHLPDTIRQTCEKVFVLTGGKVVAFDDVDKAFQFHNAQQLESHGSAQPALA